LLELQIGFKRFGFVKAGRMGTAARAVKSGCGAGRQVRPEEAPCVPWRNTAFDSTAKVDSLTGLAQMLCVGSPPARKIIIFSGWQNPC